MIQDLHQRVGTKLGLAIFLGFVLIPVVLAVLGGKQILRQERALRSHVPVPAEVLSVHVERRVSGAGRSRSVHHKPIVLYRYEIEGVHFVGKQVTPLNESSSQAWAVRTAARFQAGERIEAWIDPRDPRSGYLIREASFTPYTMALVGLLLAGIAILFLPLRKRADPGAPEVTDDGRLRLHARRPLDTRGELSFLRLLLYHLPGAAVLGHWHFVAAAVPAALLPALATAVYVGVGLVPIVLHLRARRLRSRLSDASLHCRVLSRDPVAEIEVEVEQEPRDELLLETLSVTLVHEARSSMQVGGRTVAPAKRARSTVQVLGDRQFLIGDRIRGHACVEIPERPSFGKPELDDRARSFFWLTVTTKAGWTPVYRERFDLPLPPEGLEPKGEEPTATEAEVAPVPAGSLSGR